MITQNFADRLCRQSCIPCARKGISKIICIWLQGKNVNRLTSTGRLGQLDLNVQLTLSGEELNMSTAPKIFKTKGTNYFYSIRLWVVRNSTNSFLLLLSLFRVVYKICRFSFDRLKCHRYMLENLLLNQST